MDTFAIPIGSGRATRGRFYPAAPPGAGLLVLAHGAGAGQDHPWMTGIAAGLAAHGVDVVTFDFPYVHERRRVPDRAPLLEACFRGALDSALACGDGDPERQLFIGGKSMGGRMATHLAASAVPGISGVVVFGYPLHPPGRPDAPRAAHLPAIRVPMLVIQGARDTFGTPEELRPALDTVPAPVTLHIVEGGDHGFRVRGVPAAETQVTLVEVAAGWLREHTRPARHG